VEPYTVYAEVSAGKIAELPQKLKMSKTIGGLQL